MAKDRYSEILSEIFESFEFAAASYSLAELAFVWSSDPSLPAAASGCLIPPLAVRVQDVLVHRPPGPVRLQKVRPQYGEVDTGRAVAANPTCGLIGHGPALAFRLSGNAVAVRTEPLGLN